MFWNRSKKQDAEAKLMAEAITSAIRELAEAWTALSQARSQDGLLSARMLAYFDYWVYSPANQTGFLREFSREKNPLDLFRIIMDKLQELLYENRRLMNHNVELSGQVAQKDKEIARLVKGN